MTGQFLFLLRTGKHIKEENGKTPFLNKHD